MPTDDLSEFPQSLHDTDQYPWEGEPALVIWPYGDSKGMALSSFLSAELLRKRRWLERTHAPDWLRLTEAIDAILIERGGEL